MAGCSTRLFVDGRGRRTTFYVERGENANTTQDGRNVFVDESGENVDSTLITERGTDRLRCHAGPLDCFLYWNNGVEPGHPIYQEGFIVADNTDSNDNRIIVPCSEV